MGEQDGSEDVRARCWQDRHPSLDQPSHFIRGDYGRRMFANSPLARFRSSGLRFISVPCSMHIRQQRCRSWGHDGFLSRLRFPTSNGAKDRDINWPPMLDICKPRAYLHIYDETHVSELMCHAVRIARKSPRRFEEKQSPVSSRSRSARVASHLTEFPVRVSNQPFRRRNEPSWTKLIALILPPLTVRGSEPSRGRARALDAADPAVQ